MLYIILSVVVVLVGIIWGIVNYVKNKKIDPFVFFFMAFAILILFITGACITFDDKRDKLLENEYANKSLEYCEKTTAYIRELKIEEGEKYYYISYIDNKSVERIEAISKNICSLHKSNNGKEYIEKYKFFPQISNFEKWWTFDGICSSSSALYVYKIYI